MINLSRKPSAVLLIALLIAPGSGLANAKPLEVRWNELAPIVTGHTARAAGTRSSAHRSGRRSHQAGSG